MLILKSMVSVEFASVNWLIKVRSPELKKPAGSIEYLMSTNEVSANLVRKLVPSLSENERSEFELSRVDVVKLQKA